MMVKPQSVHVVTSPTFAHLQVLVHRRGMLQTSALAPPSSGVNAFACRIVALLI